MAVINNCYIWRSNKTSKLNLKSYSDGILEKDVEESDTDDFAASMGDEDDDGGAILKEFLSNQSRVVNFSLQKEQERYELEIPSLKNQVKT